MSTVDANVTDEVNEFVFAEWLDSRTGPMSLGYLSAVNKHSSQFTLKIGLDGSKIFARFALWVSFKRSGRSVRKELFLVLSLKAISQQTSPLSFEYVHISEIGDSAAAVQDAGLSNAGSIIRAQFNLTELGYILMPATKSEKIRPSTEAARHALLAFKSFSKALSFTVYMKPSDYATRGLRTVCQYLNECEKVEQLPLAHSDMYMGQGAEVLDWDKCDLGTKSPPYEGEPLPLPPTPPSRVLTSIFSDKDSDVLVHNSPTKSPDCQVSISQASITEPFREISVIPRTPGADPELTPTGEKEYEKESFVLQRPRVEAVCQNKRRLNSPELLFSKRLRHDEQLSSIRQLSPPPQLSPPYQLSSPNQSSPPYQLSSDQQLRSVSANDTTSEIIATFSTWIAKALVVNETIYKHSRLQPFFRVLRQRSRNGNRFAFDELQAEMAAEFFYNPNDDLDDEELKCAAARTFVRDMELLGKWMLGVDRLAHVTMFNEMLKLGKAAKEAVNEGALRPSFGADLNELAQYNGTKASCISFVMMCLGEEKEVGNRINP